MHGSDGGGPLADRRGDPLRRPRTHIADREEPGMARLERERSATERRPTLTELIIRERTVGEDEAVVVEGRAPRQPIRARFRTDKREQGRTEHRALLLTLKDPDTGESFVSFEGDHVGFIENRDSGVVPKAIDEITGHVGSEVRLSDDDSDRAPLVREEDRRLASGVAAAHHHYRAARAQSSF
jgi:hypothetical protein